MQRAVLVTIKGLGIGGAEKLISESARHWDRLRFEYHVAYALPWKDQLVAELEALDVPVHCFGSQRGMTPASWGRLRQLVRHTGAELVHAHLPAVGAVARVVSPVPVVYTEHNVAGSYRLPVRVANRLTYGRAAAITAVSQAVADSVAGYPGPDVAVVSNGVSCAVDTEGALAARTELGIGPDTPLVLHVGNIRPHKGHTNLIDAVSRLVKRVPDVVVVSIGGEKNDGDLARVRNQAQTAGLGDHLRFLGRRDDALAFVSAADAFANPSDHEGLPVAILEAMALERPVVATAVGGVPVIVQDDVTGLLVPARDPEALANGLARVLTDRSVATRLAAAGRSLIERDFSLDTMVRRLESIYDQLLEPSSP